MAMFKWFRKKPKTTPLPEKETRKTQPEDEIQKPLPKEDSTPKPFDYGMDLANLYLASNDYGWHIRGSKRVLLVNPLECKERVTFMALVSCWRETGHSEWEALLAYFFLDAVTKAIRENRSEAEITYLFDRDFIARNDLIFTKEQVMEHLLPWFEKIEETENELKLKLRLAA